MTKLYILLLPAIVFLTSSITVEAVKLQYKYEKNIPVVYELVMDSSSSFVSPDSGKREVKMKTIVRMKQELIEEDKEGNLKVAMTVLSAEQEVNGVRKPTNSAMNQTQIVRMRKNGKLLSALSQGPGQSMGENAMQMVFPEESLKAGDTWTQLKDIAQPIPVETRTLYKVTKVAGDKITISSIMKLKNSGGDAVQAMTKGNTVFDAKLGRIVESFADSKFQFEIPLKVPGLLPNNSNVKVSMHMQMAIKEVKPDTKKD